jgi:hypothetical protein
MTNRERVMAVINGTQCDQLPSQIDFTPTQIEKLCHLNGMNEDQLMLHAGNCIRYVNSLGNVYYS